MNTSGTLLWTGLWVDQTGENDDLNPQIVTAGTGGAVISWQDNRDITDHNWDIYAQNVSGDPHIITATAGPNGTISPSGPVGVVDQTGRLSFDFIPNTGYHEDDFLLGGTSAARSPRIPPYSPLPPRTATGPPPRLITKTPPPRFSRGVGTFGPPNRTCSTTTTRPPPLSPSTPTLSTPRSPAATAR